MAEPGSVYQEQIQALKKAIDQSHRIVAFTGAGISAESGIPTYRDTGAIKTKYDPDKYASIEYFQDDPGYFWSYFRDVRLTAVKSAKPNPAHLKLAELEARGKLISVVTQNIDGLHQLAGSYNVRELHGNTTRFRCVSCLMPYDFSQIEMLLAQSHVPQCRQCSGILRPDVVLFGEMLPDDVFDLARREASSADLMMVVGSSLVVYPAADIPYQATLSGAKLAIVNIDPTPFDAMADILIHASAGQVLAEVIH